VDYYLKQYNQIERLSKSDGSPWDSLDEFLNPPVEKKGDYFSKVGRLNQIKGSQMEIPGVDFTLTGDPPFALENIVILTDAMCGSTCAITVEALASIGIATVVSGGQPVKSGKKSMQHVGGIKGYQVLEYENIAVDPEVNLGPLNDYIPRTVDMKITAKMNFQNSYTPDDNIIPQEFIFQPADGHLWYTKQMLVDRTILWNDVIKLTWDEAGNNKLVGSNSSSSAKGSHGGKHKYQPYSGYGSHTPQSLKDGIKADFDFLGSTWLNAFGGKKK